MKNKSSVIITAFKESKTIKKAITSIANQKMADEIIVIAPDDETLNQAEKLKSIFKELRILRDPGEGKPQALNIAVSKSKGDILILTDGDVFVSENSIKPLLDKFDNPKVGAVTGRPVSIDNKNYMFGYWGHLLSSIAHQRRFQYIKNGKRIFCSGYLFAIKKSLFPKLKKEILSEDGFVSHIVYEKGFRIEYCPSSIVYVKYPRTFKDWINQKRRSVGGYNQIKALLGVNIRSFGQESSGALSLFRYVKSLKESYFLIMLFLARIYLWLLIYRDINFRKKSHKELWVRIETTK